MFCKKSAKAPEKPTHVPPPSCFETVRYDPLFNYIELFSGKELRDGDKKTVITLAEAGIAPPWPPK